MIHLIRGTIRYASRKYWDELVRDLKPIYQASNEAAAAAALDALEDKWGTRYPAMIRLWRNAWAEFIPFLTTTWRSGGCSTDQCDRVAQRPLPARCPGQGHFRTSSQR